MKVLIVTNSKSEYQSCFNTNLNIDYLDYVPEDKTYLEAYSLLVIDYCCNNDVCDINNCNDFKSILEINNGYLPVICVIKANNNVYMKAHKYHIVDYIYKPLDFSKLATIIESHVLKMSKVSYESSHDAQLILQIEKRMKEAVRYKGTISLVATVPVNNNDKRLKELFDVVNESKFEDDEVYEVNNVVFAILPSCSAESFEKFKLKVSDILNYDVIFTNSSFKFSSYEDSVDLDIQFELSVLFDKLEQEKIHYQSKKNSKAVSSKGVDEEYYENLLWTEVQKLGDRREHLTVIKNERKLL